MADPTAADAAVAVLRVGAGLVLAGHGYQKVFAGGKLAGTGRWFESLGMKPGWLHARLAAFTEIGAGLFLALGFLTPLAAGGLIALMIVAAVTVHMKNGFWSVNDGWELNYLYAVVGVAIGIIGGGYFSLDHVFWPDVTWLSGWWGFAIAAVAGVGGGLGQLIVFWRPPKPAPAA